MICSVSAEAERALTTKVSLLSFDGVPAAWQRLLAERPAGQWLVLMRRCGTDRSMCCAFPGAVPPLIGWAVARGRLDPAAWIL
jgi:hypothetical protein